ncbi:multidrug ABC transporter substrate-binding protein [Halioglobus japonicus]|uniref:Lipoprotein-releasing system transmembrane subunit, LolC/LolE family n=1 Tax=Halioglobus japonicus TaxID=930805 RepID=A0AAP8SNM8_9GAMM|nr:lipoprotein-releasing ABC transporter permease subunit [Halioglobus japonicus]PLW86792.1 lipoprotein-releasing system transmembrane subunit, LolC/LolE family [Halioglobus japonicus]GHD11044.1 multidrug ABC transporter substrate-binding protein [Halioglobus japonicus]
MTKPGGSIANYAPFIGLRYSFSRKRSRFTAVISLVSMLGMVLGVASLITVLSVMNGFAGELRGRILSLVPHGYVSAPDGVSDWQALGDQLLQAPGIDAYSPYISEKVILASGRSLRGAVLTAIDPAYEQRVSRASQAMVQGELAALADDSFSVVLGGSLARMLGVRVGDSVEVTVPRLTMTPLGVFPRSKRLTVVGLFEVGAQPDTFQAYVGLAAGQKLLGPRRSVEGLQLKTADLISAPQTIAQLADQLPEGYQLQDWSQTQGSLFRAVKMEKVMVSLLLLSVVAVAAFNIVSTLVMSVAEKRRDIAVLRTMGARASGVMAIFVAHGLGLALVGITAGAIIGVLLATNISAITLFIENLFGVKLFDPSVYFISELPSVLMPGDVLMVTLASLALSLLATIYPAWRAANVAPAEVLRYE